MRVFHRFPAYTAIHPLNEAANETYRKQGKSCYEIPITKELEIADVILISGLSYKEGIDVVLLREKGGDVLLNLTEFMSDSPFYEIAKKVDLLKSQRGIFGKIRLDVSIGVVIGDYHYKIYVNDVHAGDVFKECNGKPCNLPKHLTVCSQRSFLGMAEKNVQNARKRCIAAHGDLPPFDKLIEKELLDSRCRDF
ncbi:unnamed protein product [Enterobius vermicularis]|uniref:DUF362 domain-containing protein n=1 Tax=Enterobius vermicularis TaxID=51028 RepID=A0A158QAJ3_ENTVE|nr:unnamed protein product [Enterobius vermicularis]